jgi:hypothetical protein
MPSSPTKISSGASIEASDTATGATCTHPGHLSEHYAEPEYLFLQVHISWVPDTTARRIRLRTSSAAEHLPIARKTHLLHSKCRNISPDLHILYDLPLPSSWELSHKTKGNVGKMNLYKKS